MKITKLAWLAGLVAVASVIGAVAYSPQSANAAPTTGTKACVAGALPNTANCTLTFTDPALPTAILGAPVNTTFTVTLTGPATFASTAPATVTGTGCTAVATPTATAGGTTFTVTVAASSLVGTPRACTVTVTEVLNITGNGAIVQNVAGNGGQLLVPATGVPAFVVAAPATTQIIPDGCTVITGQSTGIVPGTITATSVNVNVGGSVRLSCILDIDDNQAGVAGDFVSSGIVSVTVGSPASGVVVSIAGLSDQNGVSGTVTSGQTANVTCGRVGGVIDVDDCDFVIVDFTVTAGATAPSSMPVQITANYVPDFPDVNTPAALAATTVFTVVTALAPVGTLNATAAAKVCSTTGLVGSPTVTVVGQPINCVVTLNFPATAVAIPAQTITVVVTNGTIGTLGGPTTQTFSCPAIAAGSAATTCTFNEVIFPTTAGVLPTQTVAVGAFAAIAAPITGIVAPVAFAPAVTQIIPDGCEIVSGTGLVNSPLDVLATSANVTVGGSVTVECVLDIDDNQVGTAGDFVSSGTVTVTVGSPAGGVVASILGFTDNNGTSGTVAGTNGQTANITCGRTTAGATTVDGCDFVVVRFTVAANATAPFSRVIQITADYTPDFPNLNTPAALAATTVFTVNTVINVSTLVGPSSLRIECFNNFAGATSGSGLANTSQIVGGATNVSPGQLGGAGVLAVGVLPGAVSCQVVSRDAAGNLVAFAPGTIEVSSLNGTLIDLSGRLTTNLRIPCGQAVVVNVASGATLNPNTCLGVTFGVLGLGVGDVELRARYEPTPDVPGLNEVEVSGMVRFVAPVVGVTLTLNPNPVAVGATGTATASLFQAFAAACGSTTTTVTVPGATATTGGVTVTVPSASSVTTTTVPCIDPATGSAISTTGGSVLNGVVIFTIEDSAIARFVSSLTGPGATVSGATAGTTLNFGVTNTANQVIASCGAFSGGGTPFVNVGGVSGPLSPFFGGCSNATAFYRGVNAGATNIAATFVPFLPGAASAVSTISGATLSTAFGAGIAGLNFFGTLPSSTFRVLQVADVAPSGLIQLAAGCNNVSPTVTESISAFLARVTPAAVVRGVFEYQTATSRFTAAPGAAAPAGASAAADLTGVTRLRPVFVCVNAAATLDQPAA